MIFRTIEKSMHVGVEWNKYNWNLRDPQINSTFLIREMRVLNQMFHEKLFKKTSVKQVKTLHIKNRCKISEDLL